MLLLLQTVFICIKSQKFESEAVLVRSLPVEETFDIQVFNSQLEIILKFLDEIKQFEYGEETLVVSSVPEFQQYEEPMAVLHCGSTLYAKITELGDGYKVDDIGLDCSL